MLHEWMVVMFVYSLISWSFSVRKPFDCSTKQYTTIKCFHIHLAVSFLLNFKHCFCYFFCFYLFIYVSFYDCCEIFSDDKWKIEFKQTNVGIEKFCVSSEREKKTEARKYFFFSFLFHVVNSDCILLYLNMCLL